LDPTAIIWSLSIEEQFYLLWPPLLLLALWAKANRKHIVIALGICILGIAVHRYSLWSHGAELNRMYYGSDTRADAPLVGCLVALLSLGRTHGTKRTNLALKASLNLGAFASACLLIYLVATATFTDQFLYRGGYTLVAGASGLLVWHLADADESFMKRILEFYPLRWFGLISYGLYLWHWLLLREVSFYRWGGEKDAAVRFAVAIVVSAASFYLFERRFARLKTRFGYSINTETSPLVCPLISNLNIKPVEQES
jgi:peptidoglycan/LPS O-acetylase OafA/YrhL